MRTEELGKRRGGLFGLAGSPYARRHRANEPTIHAASHVHELHGFLFHACTWFCSYSYGALLRGPSYSGCLSDLEIAIRPARMDLSFQQIFQNIS